WRRQSLAGCGLPSPHNVAGARLAKAFRQGEPANNSIVPASRTRHAGCMTFEITSQRRQMIATVRALAQSEFKADAIKYMDGSFPWENMKKLAKLGVLGMSVPEEYGGMGHQRGGATSRPALRYPQSVPVL